jgi:anti-sigma28 factor (negative regulator of flagellin synthesis)
MSIKIDGNRPAADTEATRRVDTGRRADRAPSDRQPARTDRVEVSRDAQLATTAVHAAMDAPAVRPDVVERARRLLDSGALGADSRKLADAIIDDLLKG